MPENRDIKKLIDQKRKDILRIASKYGASNIRIFGSVARGDNTADSDVDFLVDMEKGHSLLDRAGLMLELQELLGFKVDVATVKSLKDRIKDRVMKEAVPL
jgi:uncharacterized protein